MNLTGQTVIVAGGAGDIGRFVATGLAADAATVIVLDRNEAPFAELAAHANITCHAIDLTDAAATAALIERLFQDHPTISALINCTGLIYSAPLINILSKEERKHSMEAWRKVIDINLTAVFHTGLCVIDQMVARRTKGVIVNVSSIAARGNAGQSAYAAAKAAVEAMTVTWSKELAMFGIRSAAIAPGFFDTPSTHSALSTQQLEKTKNMVPLKRLGSLDELLSGIRFIIQNDYYNGRVLALDGGIVL